MIYQNPIFWAILVLLGAVIGYFIRQLIAANKLDSVERKVKKQTEDSRTKANELILEAQEKATSLLEESKKAEREQKLQLTRMEERLVKREEAFEKQWADLKQEQGAIKADIEKINSAKAQISELKIKLNSELEKISKLSESEAKDKLLKEVEEKYKQDLTQSAIDPKIVERTKRRNRAPEYGYYDNRNAALGESSRVGSDNHCF